MEIETFILVGGRSRRMGRDKAMLELGGVTLAERLAAAAREAFPGAPVTLVTASTGQFPDMTVVPDIRADRGPVGGLHAALTHARSEWILLLGCDLPFVTAELIDRLVGFLADATDAVVPLQRDGIVQPLCAVYRVDTCLDAATRLLAGSGTPSLKDVLAEVRVHFAAFDQISDLPGSENFFLNINTPADLECARRLCV